MDIRVCGLGIISPLGAGGKENLSSLLNSRCGINALTHFESSVGSPVGEVSLSNEELKSILNINPKKTISRTSLLGIYAANEAIQDAQIPKGKKVGLISSTSVAGMDLSENFYKEYLKDNNKGRLREIVGHDCASSTEAIADYCKIEGFRTTISTACSSAANAIIMGAQLLECDMLDYVIVGGTDSLCQFTYNGFNSLMILDKDLCTPLDQNRKGLNLAEGAAYIVLSKDQDSTKSYCKLLSYANANDAHHQTASSDDGEGAYLAMSKAMAKAQMPKIDYINLHGTGTPNNDQSELAAIVRIFGNNIPFCSSTKSYTGHTLAASGGIEAVFSILSLTENTAWPNLRFQTQIEPFNISPLTKVTKDKKLNVVMSNSFGFGGNCSSLIFSNLNE